MNHQSILFLLIVLLIASCGKKVDESLKYLRQKPPSTNPEIFAPGIISTESEYEYGSVFNADASAFYYGVAIDDKAEIRFSKLQGNTWSEPKTMLSHETYSFNDPFLSPNEDRLYFISDMSRDSSEGGDYDIWYVERGENGWSAPINAGPNINSVFNEYYMSFTNDGTMYFSSNIRGDNFDIYASKNHNGAFQTAMSLSDSINTPHYEADVFIAPDEAYMIFCANRPEGLGRGDLYISFRKADGRWSKSKNMGPTINSEHHELCPFVSKDGKYFFYTSDRDIYWVNAEIIEGFRE